MRSRSLTARAIITVAVATSVAASALTATRPALGQTAPVASPDGSATPTTEVAESPSASAGACPTSTASIPVEAPIESRIDVGAPVGPRWFTSDGTSLWVHEPTSLVRVDLATSTISGIVPMDSIDYGYDTSGAGAVWETDFDRDLLLKVDPVADKVVASIPVGSAPNGVAVTAGSVWVADHHGGAITRVDPATNRVVATIPVGPTGIDGPQTMFAGPNGVWVDVPNIGSVVRIDPATNAVGPIVPLNGPVASDGMEVWIGVEAGPNGLPQAVRIDPVSGQIITTVDLHVQSLADDLAIGLGSVWVLTSDGLYQIDAATGCIVGRIDLDDGGDVLVAGGAVWVSTNDKPSVLRISPQ